MQREEPRQLNCFVPIDDAYLGGECSGSKPGRGSENKQAFVIAIAADAHLDYPTFAVIEQVRAFDKEALTDWAKRRLAPEAEAFSDGLAPFVVSRLRVMPIPCTRAKAAERPPKSTAPAESTCCCHT